MHCTLRQLEIFVEAARDCNFAKAASRLGISQPAISDHIRALEKNLDSELFIRRRGTTPRLSITGERLRQEAEAILDHRAQLSRRAAAARRTVSLRMFAGPHIFERMLRTALPAFHRAHPNIALNICSELSVEEVGGLIERRELDVAVFTAMSAVLPLDAQVICDVPCVVAASRSLVGDAELTPEEISRLPFVLPLEGTGTARWIERTLAQLGVVPERIIGRTQFLDVQQTMVEQGEAAALLFRENIEASPVRDQLRRLSPEVVGLQRALLMHRGEQRSEVKSVAEFVKRAIGAAPEPARALAPA